MLEAEDFRAESRTLAAILAPLDDHALKAETLFKGWTIEDVLGHLHMFNIAAQLSLQEDGEFDAFLGPVFAAIAEGRSMIAAQDVWLDERLGGLRGAALRDAWAETAERTADAYLDVDPKRRLKWAGPDMSARSMITARQMETWAHGQEVFDILGLEREEADRVRNICHLGVATYGWTFQNRGETPPEPAPFVRLTGPSGAIWEWNEPRADERVEGSAVAFAKVVAQTRNIADVSLRVAGPNASRWMAVAQCFAGAPNDPPPPGLRRRAAS